MAFNSALRLEAPQGRWAQAGASSATWMKLNTGAGCGRPLDCNVRNASRVTSILTPARHRDQHPCGVIAKRGGERDLLLRGRARCRDIRSSEVLHEPRRQQFDGCRAIFFGRFDNSYQGRPTEGVDPQKAGAKGASRLARQRCWIELCEHEGARYGPFARLRRLVENKGIRRISPDGLQKLHPVLHLPASGLRCGASDQAATIVLCERG